MIDEDDAYAGRFHAGASATTQRLTVTFRKALSGAVVPCHSAALRISSTSALAGVITGAFLTGRVQKRQWTRTQQIDACAAVVVESTRVQLALRAQWKRDERVDWAPWNEALARVSLVADRAVVEAAGDMDAVFWQHSVRIDREEVTDEAAWFDAVRPMEAARLAFVNAAKRHVLGSAQRLDRLPIRRPSGYMPGVCEADTP